MRTSLEPARRSFPGPRLRWLVAAVLAAGVLLFVLQEAAGPWLIALSGGLAVLVSVAGLAAARSSETQARSSAGHVESGWTALRTELARSRRHDRKFALVGVPDRVWLPTEASGRNPDVPIDLARSVQAFIRRPDRAWADASMLHIMLTDCDRRQGHAFLERARRAMPQLFDDDAVRLVVFPDDGITLGALVTGLVGGAVAEEAAAGTDLVAEGRLDEPAAAVAGTGAPGRSAPIGTVDQVPRIEPIGPLIGGTFAGEVVTIEKSGRKVLR
jgi:hypothetical protein